MLLVVTSSSSVTSGHDPFPTSLTEIAIHVYSSLTVYNIRRYDSAFNLTNECFNRGGPLSIAGQATCDLLCTKCHWDTGLFRRTSDFSCQYYHYIDASCSNFIHLSPTLINLSN
jgi:hypothetical protein